MNMPGNQVEPTKVKQASYTISPDAPGQPGTAFKVFANGVKVATLTIEQVYAAVTEHTGVKVHDMR